VQICFSVVLILLAHLENTPKVFYRSLRIRQKYLLAFRKRTKSLSAHTEITAIFEMFYLYEFVSECGKSSLACTENTLTAFKRIRRKRQDFAALIGTAPSAARVDGEAAQQQRRDCRCQRKD
jgi:hypothetical protein